MAVYGTTRERTVCHNLPRNIGRAHATGYRSGCDCIPRRMTYGQAWPIARSISLCHASRCNLPQKMFGMSLTNTDQMNGYIAYSK